MKKIISYLIYILMLFVSFYNYTFADNNLEKVYKIESYSFDELSDTYNMEQYGSSIYMGKGLIYTNAHVILDENNIPIGNYRVCKTINFKENAKCFSVGELLYYDTVNDLAVLKVSNTEDNGVKLSKKELNIGDTVKVYGYPSNGGETITYTEGKISGFEKGLYKIDANLDAGNSGGGVFDSDGNLIGIATSVGVGYTTLGYVIPLENIKSFIEKKGENIEKYNKSTKDSFLGFTLGKNKVIGASSFKNDFISLNNYIANGLAISDYNFNNSNKNYYLELTDKNNETTIEIQNFKVDGKQDYNLNDYYDSISKEIESSDTKISKLKKIKIKGKDAILELNVTNENEVYLRLLVEQSKNNLVQVYINSTKLKNKSFLKGLKVILNNLDFLTINSKEDKNLSMVVDNLKIDKNDGFYVLKSLNGGELINFGDIKVVNNTYEKYKIKDYGADFTLSSNINEYYKSIKDYYYIYDYSIKNTKKGENYIYMYGINNKEKGGIEDKTQDKYFINAFFYDKIDNDYLYLDKFVFTFNEEKSKKEIDDLLESVETSSGNGVFPIGDLKVGENVVESENNIK